MKNRMGDDKRINSFLVLVLLFALISRLWRLDFSSLWLDELHTMNEADPGIRWSAMLGYLKCCDQHPPLHFVICRFLFSLFGHTSYVARFPSVIAGTVSVWAMFLLGKEILNERLGLVAAILTTVNYYNLQYSQEARNYIFAFLFAVFSFLYFIRLLKNLSVTNSVLYAVFTLLLLYSHYYSLFILASQIVLIAIFFFNEEKANRTMFVKRFALSGLLIGAGYAFWIPYVLAMSNIKSFWIPPVSPNFLSEFFYDYFGNSKLLKPILLLLLLTYALKVVFTANTVGLRNLKKNPLPFSFIVLSIWIVITYLIPYLRSIFVVPMLFPRYTIVVLPAILIALAYAIQLINYKPVRMLVFSLFVIFSIIHITAVDKYYSTIRKSQFREMTAYLVNNNKENYPVINEVTSWQQQYYFKFNKFKPILLSGKKIDLVDSILHKSSQKFDLKGFWMVGAHGDKPLTAEQRKGLDSGFILAKEKQFYDAWAQLYLSTGSRTGGGGNQDAGSLINYTDFSKEKGTVLADQQAIAIWGGFIQTNPIKLEKGKYHIMISSKGDPANNEFPRLVISANGKKIADYFATAGFEVNSFDFEISDGPETVFTIELVNDYFDATTGKDRNAFIRFLRLVKIEPSSRLTNAHPL